MAYRFEPLDTARHNRAGFHSAVGALNLYLQQQARKDAGLEVSDRIALIIRADAVATAAIAAHRELIAGETLATSLDVRDAELEQGATAVGNGSAVMIEVERA